MSERRKPAGRGAGEYEEKRSRFLAEVIPVGSEEAAKAHIASVKKKYPDARHHCWAWVLPDGSFRWSDDGEPGGTAGAPILEILRGGNVYGVLCVVTRYFGGTLLGSGGLVRAYSKAAAAALADAGTEPDPEKVLFRLTARWENLDRVHRLLREYGAILLEQDYDSDPTRALLLAELLEIDGDAFAARLSDITGGKDQAVRVDD